MSTSNDTNIILHNDNKKEIINTFSTKSNTQLIFNMPEIEAGIYTINV